MSSGIENISLSGKGHTGNYLMMGHSYVLLTTQDILFFIQWSTRWSGWLAFKVTGNRMYFWSHELLWDVQNRELNPQYLPPIPRSLWQSVLLQCSFWKHTCIPMQRRSRKQLEHNSDFTFAHAWFHLQKNTRLTQKTPPSQNCTHTHASRHRERGVSPQFTACAMSHHSFTSGTVTSQPISDNSLFLSLHSSSSAAPLLMLTSSQNIESASRWNVTFTVAFMWLPRWHQW